VHFHTPCSDALVLSSWAPPASASIEYRTRFIIGSAQKSPPISRRANVTFPLEKLNLSPSEQDVFKALVGPRYNEETGLVKFSSDGFESAEKNVARLRTILSQLLDECKRLK
jgi:hypothetical protein